MTERQPPAPPTRFDHLCQGLEEYDALPPAPAGTSDPRDRQPPEPPDEALDPQILAGLVSPL